MFKWIQIPIVLSLVSWIFVLSISSGCSTNLTFVGATHLEIENVTCTLVECICCNTCNGLISFVTANDTILLTGAPNGKQIACKGSDCDLRNNRMHCEPLELYKNYEITGKFVTVGKGVKVKVFKVTSFKIVD